MATSIQNTAGPTLKEKVVSNLREYWRWHLIGTIPGAITTIALYTFLTLAFIEKFG